MKKRKILSLLLVGAMLSGLVSCGRIQLGGEASSEVFEEGESDISGSELEPEESAEQEAQTDKKAFGVGYYESEGINPFTCSNAQNQSICGLAYEGLVEVDTKFRVKSNLAESITVTVKKKESVVEQKKDATENGQETDTADSAESSAESSAEQAVETVITYSTSGTITLREGITFWDGSVLKADDVVYSLKLAMKDGSIYQSRLSNFKNIVAKDSKTITFQVRGGQKRADALLEVPIVKEGSGGKAVPVGTGAYKIETTKKGKPKKLVAYDGWWKLTSHIEGEDVVQEKKQPFEELVLNSVKDSDELIFGFSNGAITMVGCDLTSGNALQYTGVYEVCDYPTSNLLYLGCNTGKGSACNATKVRYSLYRSIDRELIAVRMLASHAVAASMPLSPRSELYDEELDSSLEYTVKQAKKLYKDNGVSGQLTLIVNQDSSFKVAIAKEIKKELETAGWSVKVEVLAWKNYRNALKKGEYDLYLGEVKLNSAFDVTRLVTSGGSLNYSDYEDAKLTQALEEYNSADESERQEKATAFYKRLASKAPIIPICFKNDSVLIRAGAISNITATQQNLYSGFTRWKFNESLLELS